MNTEELNEANLGLHYVGCYPADNLPTVDRNPFAFITNLDPSNLPGTHWVAIYINNRKGEYFDSGGFYPPPRLEKYLNRYCLDWKYNKKLIQHPKSSTCGRYCMYFVKNRPKDKTLRGTLKRFTHRLIKNEKIIQKWKP